MCLTVKVLDCGRNNVFELVEAFPLDFSVGLGFKVDQSNFILLLFASTINVKEKASFLFLDPFMSHFCS